MLTSHVFLPGPDAVKRSPFLLLSLFSTDLGQSYKRNYTRLLHYKLDDNHFSYHRLNLGYQAQLLLRYVLQSAVNSILRERNSRRHGELHSPPQRLEKLINKNVRNRFSLLHSLGEKRYDCILMAWFTSRT